MSGTPRPRSCCYPATWKPATPRPCSKIIRPDPGDLLKDRVYDAAAVGDALRRVSIGECVIDPEIISQLLRRGRERNPLDALTDREREILSLMAQGYSNDSICNQLFISRRTVESYVSSVFANLGIVESPESSRRVLAVLAYLQG